MYESKQEITEAVGEIYGIASGLKRGDILTHEQIGEVLGLAPHEGRWDYIVHRALKRLEAEKGIAYWVLQKTVGYSLLTSAEQLELPSWRTAKGLRQVKRGRKSLAALPEKGLTLNQRRSRLFIIDHLKETERGMRRTLKAQREQLQPTATLPRRPMVAGARVEARA